MLTTVYLKGMILPGVEPPTAWKLDIMLGTEYIDKECYELKSLESDNRTTLVLSNTRELDRELFYKLVYLFVVTTTRHKVQ